MSPAPVLERKSPMARAVLLGCQTACHADDFTEKLLTSLAAVFDAPYCMWTDAREGGLVPLAFTPGAEKALPETLPWAARAMREGPVTDGRVAAAPMRFRSQTAGVLVTVRPPGGLDHEHLNALTVVGRAAVARYEQLQLAEELALAPGPDPSGVLGCLIHELSQPLSVIGAAAFYLNMVLPRSEEKLRLHLEKLEEQVDIAARVLQNASRSVRPWPPKAAESRSLTNAASSSLV